MDRSTASRAVRETLSHRASEEVARSRLHVGWSAHFSGWGVSGATQGSEAHRGEGRRPSPLASWWTVRDSNLRGLEASGPEAPAFQGRLRFPGWGPSLVFYGLEPSSWLLASKTTGVPTLRIPHLTNGAKPTSRRLERPLLRVGGQRSDPRERSAQGGGPAALPPCFLVDGKGFEPTRPRSLGARGPCVSRPPTLPGVGPLPRFLRLGAKQLAPRLENHGCPHPSNPSPLERREADFTSAEAPTSPGGGSAERPKGAKRIGGRAGGPPPLLLGGR